MIKAFVKKLLNRYTVGTVGGVSYYLCFFIYHEPKLPDMNKSKDELWNILQEE